MKYLLVLIVILAGAWLLLGRRGKDLKPPGSSKPTQDGATQMVACAHCGLHLPEAEAILDGAQRVYCGEPHRIAGPR